MMDAIVFFISEEHVKISISVTLDSMDDVDMNLHKVEWFRKWKWFYGDCNALKAGASVGALTE